MSFQHFPGVGMVHLHTVKPARVVPGNERHSWLNKHLLRGQCTTCTKCSCAKAYDRDYQTRYRMPGGQVVTERPTCPGKPSPQQATATPSK